MKETLSAIEPKQAEEGNALPDSPGVIVFPPVLFVSAIALGTALQILWPIHMWGTLSGKIIGMLLALTGMTGVISAKRAMRRVGTNIHPSEPTTALVTDGPYRFTRNPIYLGATMVYFGLALLFNAFWPLPALAPFLVLLGWGVVLREERYLEKKFGQTYLAYKAQVPRWI